VLVENNDAGSASEATLAVDRNGNVTAVWSHDDGTGIWSIWSNRYPADGPWGTPVLVENNDAGSAGEATLAVDRNGNVTAVWSQDDGTGIWSIWSNRYPAGGPWGTPVLVETDDVRSASSPALAVDPAGNATVAWIRGGVIGSSPPTVWSRRYPADGPSGTALRISPVSLQGLDIAKIVVDPNGNVTVVWAGWGESIGSNRYPAGGDWETAALVAPGSTWWLDVAVDAAGNLTTVWARIDHGLYTSPYASRYTDGGPWDTEVKIDSIDDDDTIFEPRVIADRGGNVTVVWTKLEAPDNELSIWSNRYPSSGPWGTAVRIDTADAGTDASGPDLAVDPSGNVTSVWSHLDGGVWSNRYPIGGPWGMPVRIHADGAGRARWATLAVDSAGNVTAVWSQEASAGGRIDIWSSRFE
jgi:hypothetical protein